jgi:SEC-C motif domain protein
MYLTQSWHPSTRPNDITHQSLLGFKWLGLTIENTQTIDETHASVTYKARFKVGKQKNEWLNETSQFLLENGHWFYVDGVVHSG